MKKLGKLEKVQIQDVWPNEAGDFTPWLAQENNIAYLSEEISIDLEVKSSEEPVGPFRADIVCRDTTDDSLVLIENQYGRTDHKHLGQLLTYASGLDAVTIIWISEKFTEEHRAAIDWFNNKTDDSVAFFGIEIELYRIGDSVPAPKFNVIAKPNNWSKAIKRSANNDSISDGNQFYLEYWTKFKEYCEETGATFRVQEPKPRYSISMITGWSKSALKTFINREKKRIGVFLVVRGSGSLARFRQLRKQYEAESINTIGKGVEWDEDETRKVQRVNLIIEDKDPYDRADWNDQFRLLKAIVEKYLAYFDDKVKD